MMEVERWRLESAWWDEGRVCGMGRGRGRFRLALALLGVGESAVFGMGGSGIDDGGVEGCVCRGGRQSIENN